MIVTWGVDSQDRRKFENRQNYCPLARTHPPGQSSCRVLGQIPKEPSKIARTKYAAQEPSPLRPPKTLAFGVDRSMTGTRPESGTRTRLRSTTSRVTAGHQPARHCANPVPVGFRPIRLRRQNRPLCTNRSAPGTGRRASLCSDRRRDSLPAG